MAQQSKDISLKQKLTTNFLWRKYWYWHNSQQGGPLRRREETSSHFCKVKQFRVILCNINLSTYCFYNHFLLTQLTQFPQTLLLPSSILMRDKVALLNWERSRKPYASATKNVTCFLFVLRLAKDLARTLKEGLERRFLVEGLGNILLHTQASTQCLKITQKSLIFQVLRAKWAMLIFI